MKKYLFSVHTNVSSKHSIKLCIAFYTDIYIYTGQFWNIPITVNDNGGVFSVIEINEAQSSNYRFFISTHVLQTYDGTLRSCYYAFYSERSVIEGISIIEGTYTHYQTDSLFDTTFNYSRFDNEKCKCEFQNTFKIC